MWSLFSRTSAFPYEVLDLVSEDERSLWRLHKGKRKTNGEEVSIFICEGASSSIIDLARGAVKRLKMLKHPSILKFIDSYESEKSVYLVAEVVSPLLKWVSERKTEVQDSSSIFQGMVGWGLLQITQGLSFMNNDGKLAHNNIHSSSIYVTHGGEWKIFGLEYATADMNYTPKKVFSQLIVYNPPELNSGMNVKHHVWSTDIWGLGCVVWEVFNNDPLDKSASLHQKTSKIPQSLVPMYRELVGANPMFRPNPKEVIEKLRKPGGFFHNDLIETLTFLDDFQLKDDTEKHRFFSSLAKKLDNIPDFISKNKILPALLTAHEFSNLGSVLLTPIFKIGHILEDSEYQSQIVPCVVKMFSSTDRATRLKLLQQMDTLADHLDPKTVNDQIFQPLVTGFQDTNPTIREHTVKAILFLAPKLNYNNLNVEILKHFARLQSRDDQGGIRTNTTVCLGKIASCLHPDTRQKCLVSAFTRAMRDPFPPARVAGLTAIGATQQFYPLSDVATKILPAMSHLTLDPEKTVRDSVFRIMKGFIGKLEKVSEDPDLKEVMEDEWIKVMSHYVFGEKEVVTASSMSSPASWAGWAVGALASKFYKTPTVAPVKENSESSSAAPSTRTSSITSSGESGHSTPSVAKKTSSMKSWDEDWKEEKETSSTTGVTSTLTDFSTSGDVGDGWGDDDEWGSLEVEDPSAEDKMSSDSKTSLSSTASYKWKDASDDFFSSIETKTSSSTSLAKKEPVLREESWGDWEEPSSKGSEDDVRRKREERKLQRQKDLEKKRAARAGPMKLGTKKPF